MIITCENCETSFNLNEKLLKPTGSKVRCSRCKHMFTAYPPDLPLQEQAPAETEVPEEIEERSEAAGAPESESAPEPFQEAEEDLFAQEVQEADALESTDEALPSADQEEMETALDDLDLEFDIDTVSEGNGLAAETVEDDSEGVMDASSEELDVELPPEAGEDLQASADMEDLAEETDLPDIAESLDMEPEAEETPAPDVSLEELDLDFEEEPETEAVTEDGTLEDSELELDFDELFEEEAPTEEDVPEDLDLDLDMAPEEELSAREDTSSEELDLSNMKLSMESEAGLKAETDAEELDIDLNLEMESEPETAPELTTDEAATDSEELDFSEFEETVRLDSSPEPETESVSDDAAEELDLELEMADDDVPDIESEPPSGEKEDIELEDLDFELDTASEAKAADDAEGEGVEDIDLSDIEKMLEEDGHEAETISLAPDLDDVETEVERWKETSDLEDPMDQTGEIDLSDIMIDADDDIMEEDLEDVELELDIDASSPSAIAAADIARGKEDIDISGFEDFDIPEEADKVEGHYSGEDIELEFEVEGQTDDADDMATVSDAQEIGVEPATATYAETQVMADEAPAPKKEKPKKVEKIKPIRRSSAMRPVVVVLILLIVPLAAVVLLDRFANMDVPYVTEYLKQVPYLNQLMKPEMKQAGEISVDNISSKFIDNTGHGKLFVITGTVKNEFSESRKYIKIKGSLFSSGKTLEKEESVYGGNMISDADLSSMPLNDINERLANRFGDNKSNFDVKPGKSIPFMIVFSGLPESLEEFTIEVSGSFPATSQ